MSGLSRLGSQWAPESFLSLTSWAGVMADNATLAFMWKLGNAFGFSGFHRKHFTSESLKSWRHILIVSRTGENIRDWHIGHRVGKKETNCNTHKPWYKGIVLSDSTMWSVGKEKLWLILSWEINHQTKPWALGGKPWVTGVQRKRGKLAFCC